jgi:hypothetical protein
MATTSDVLRKLAEDDGNYIALDLTGTPRLVMKDSKGQEICTVPQAHFDNLSEHSFLERVSGKWRLNDAGKAAALR